MTRIALEKVVGRIVDKWSLDFVQRAKFGDVEAMVQVAEIMFSKNGWGQVAYNPQQGRRWLELAASKGDPTAAHALRNISRLLQQRHEEAMQTNRYAINALENPKLGFDVEKKLSNLTGNSHRVTPTNSSPYLKKNVQKQAQQAQQGPPTSTFDH